jgi:hypothetical protein
MQIRNQVALYSHSIYCNQVALLPMNRPSLPPFTQALRSSVLAWPAWLRALAVAPLLALLWLGVVWASVEVAPL